MSYAMSTSPQTQPGHAHAADLEASLDFVNTLELCSTRGHPEYGGTHDALPDPKAAIDFFVDRGLAHRDELERAARQLDGGQQVWLERIRRLRTALREVWEAETDRRSADEQAIEIVNDALRHPPAVELTVRADGLGVGHRHLGDPTDEALARIVEPLVETIASGDTARFRICANDECRYVFYDDSRTARRRWCDMATCGNRAKVARHRAKLRTTPAADSPIAFVDD